MVPITLNHLENYSADSEIKNVNVGKKFVVSTRVKGIKGKPLSAYFGVDVVDNILDSKRWIRWLDDFSGEEKEIKITFTAPSDEIRFIYRINTETHKKVPCQYEVMEIDKVSINEVESGSLEEFQGEDYFLPRPKQLTEDEETTLEKNLVWILASTRSGTTWLTTQLLEYNTYHSDEPRINSHIGRQADGMPLGTTLVEQNQHRPDYFFSLVYRNTWLYFFRKLFLNRIYSQFQDLSKKIIIKEPIAGDTGIASILDCLPNSKIIWLLRDGRDVVDSQLDAIIHGFSKGGRFESYQIEPLKPEQRIGFIKARSTLWVKIMEKIGKVFENHPIDSKLLVRYEDLRKNTADELKKIYEFLKIPIKQEELENLVKQYSFENIPKEKTGVGKKTRSASIGKWKENFSEKEQKAMEDIMEETIKKLGYH